MLWKDVIVFCLIDWFFIFLPLYRGIKLIVIFSGMYHSVAFKLTFHTVAYFWLLWIFSGLKMEEFLDGTSDIYYRSTVTLFDFSKKKKSTNFSFHFTYATAAVSLACIILSNIFQAIVSLTTRDMNEGQFVFTLTCYSYICVCVCV